MEIIGLSGYARSGKDEAAAVLVEKHGFVRVAFADKLREVLYALNPLVHPSPENYFGGTKEPRRLQNVIIDNDWSNYKETIYGPEIRRLLQRLGTEAGRQTLWDSIWVDAAFANVDEDAKVIVTDCRFPNEAEAIKSRGGDVWRINRTGVGPVLSEDGTAHPSETSLDDWAFDMIIGNDSSLEAYHKKVENALTYKELK